MTSECQQIINLIKSKNEKVENISYKKVNKIELNPEENNSTSIVFNTQSISSICIDVQGIQPYPQAQATPAAVVGLTDRYLRPVPC